MKRTYLLLILLVTAIFLVSCSKPAETSQQPTDNVQETQNTEPTEPAQKEDSNPVFAARPEGIMADYWKSSDKVKSYSFTKAELVNGNPDDHYYIKGNKVKIELRIPQTIGKEHVDTVYLDTDKKTIIGRCLDPVLCGKENLNKKYDVKYSDYIIKLPMEYLKEIYSAKKIGSKQFDSKSVDVIRYENDGYFYEAFIYSYYGMPLRVAWYRDEDRTMLEGGWEFLDFSVNSVSDEDVTPPYIKME